MNTPLSISPVRGIYILLLNRKVSSLIGQTVPARLKFMVAQARQIPSTLLSNPQYLLRRFLLNYWVK